ncbi:hypothetical protein [Burkholderia contaminans]|uniref:hypothetical protein n=2 Tax=Burkholderia contaminans TaxID=488447 RepID=UPI002417CE7E|nr:hypothetical protein [Burkholderia contaminans]WFN14844.1 hypothetical protein LXE92_31775 [Burkholderia contaminans]
MNSAEEDFHGQAEVVSLICSKVRQALEGRLGAPLACQCFAIYEYGLASGVLGERSAITRGLAVRSRPLIEEMQTDSTPARYMKLSYELGLRHGGLIRIMMLELR